MADARLVSRLIVVLSGLVLGACASSGVVSEQSVVVDTDPIGKLIAERSVAGEAVVGAPDEAEVPEVVPLETGARAAQSGSLALYLKGLSDVSCPVGVEAVAAHDAGLTAQPITLGRMGLRRQQIGALSYVGGFELSSGDERFGGLSGLDILGDGNLLAVSDQGDFVWIDLADDGVTPAAARIASLLDEAGEPLRGKTDGDAEGLAINGGVALVSFERNHRVLAYDVGACGAAARGARLTTGGFSGALPDAFERAGLKVLPNQGPEPIAVTPDWYVFTGTETQKDGVAPLSARPIEAAPSFDLTVRGGALPFVGLAVLPVGDEGRDVVAYTLHRSFTPASGNAIVISEARFVRELDRSGLPARVVSDIDERGRYHFHPVRERVLAEMGAVLNNVDNFEGIAAREMKDGRVRLYIISDDNFSARQRTLLMVFELAGSEVSGK